MHKLLGIHNDIEYDSNVCLCSHHVSSLQHISALSLLSSSSELSKHIKSIPQHILSILVNVALLHSCTLCIKLLLNHWRLEHFVIPTPNVLKVWKMFCLKRRNLEFVQAVERFHESATTVVRHIAFWVSRSIVKPIRFFDLGECFISDCLVNLLAVTALTSIQKEITNYSTARLNKGETENHYYTVRVNCVLESGLCVYILLQLLKFSSRFQEGKLKLIITGLHVKPDAFGKEIFELIRLLNPEELKVLNFELCYHWSNEDRFSSLARFHYLQGIDLSYIGMNAVRRPEMFTRMSQLLHSLPHLKRLDISSSSLTNRLANVLPESGLSENCDYCSSRGIAMQCYKLQYLSLAGCRLSESDIIYLASSSCASTLHFLNINHTSFTENSIIQLLNACKNLRVLLMESCQFPDDGIPLIFEALLKMSNLRYLNIVDVNIAVRLAYYIGYNCQNLPQLRALHIKCGFFNASGTTYFPSVLPNICIGCQESHECRCMLIM